MNLRRYIQAGAVWAWPLSAQPLQEARDRAVVSGAPGVVNSPYGRALSFDGAADYVTLGAAWEDQLRFDQGTQDFSVVAWVRRAVTGAFQFIFDKRDAGNDGWILYFFNDDRLTFQLGASLAFGPTVTDTDWHSAITVVDRSADITVYTDGVAGTPVAIAGPAMATTIAPRIAAGSFDGTSKFNGDIAGVVIFPRVLSPAECLGMTGAGGGPF